MKSIKRSAFLSVLSLATVATFAQHDAQFSQYMLNRMIYNPAFAGSEEYTSITAAFRSQWIGLDGSPVTQTLSGSMPLPWLNGNAGLSIINDLIGVERNTTVMLSYAHSISVPVGKVDVGMSVGGSQHKIDGDKLRAPEGTYEGSVQHNDPNLPNAVSSSIVPDFVLGFSFANDSWYAGFSVTHLFKPSIKYKVPEAISKVKVPLVRNYYLLAGYQYEINERFTLQPSFLLKSDGRKTQVDINAHVLYNQNFLMGLAWRGITADNRDALIAIIGMHLAPQIYLGYSYDITTSALSHYSAGTHEFLLNYKLITIQQPPKIIYSPRFL